MRPRCPPPAACLALVLACAWALPAAAQQLITGVGTHFGQNASDATAGLPLASQAGIRSIRDEVYWSSTARERGQLAMPGRWDYYVNEARRTGIEPLLILDYGNKLYVGGDKPRFDEAIAAFTRYAEFVAKHFREEVRRYEVWNKRSNGIGGTTPGTADDDARLLKAVYPALKCIDPDLDVLADEVVTGRRRDSDFQKMARLDLLRFVDGISDHTYFYNRGARKTPEAGAEWMQETEAALRRYNDGAAVPLYATEIGWPTYSGRHGVTLDRSAACAARLLLLARTMPFVKGLWRYDFRNNGLNPAEVEQNFGLLWVGLTPKPAYYGVADVTAARTDAALIERRATAADDWLLRFRVANGNELWAMWTNKEGALERFDLTTLSEKPAAIMVHEVGRRSAERSWLPGRHGVWRLDLTVSDMPLLLRGDLAGVSVIGMEHPEFPGDLH